MNAGTVVVVIIVVLLLLVVVVVVVVEVAATVAVLYYYYFLLLLLHIDFVAVGNTVGRDLRYSIHKTSTSYRNGEFYDSFI